MSTYAERVRKPHAVYRCWDADDVLLYIGCSVNPEARWRQWLSHPVATWPQRTARRELTWHPSYFAAAKSESEAIESERPLHNVQYHPTNRVDRSKQRRGGPRPVKTPVYHPMLCHGI